MDAITLGKHLWQRPPADDRLNHSVAEGIASRLGGHHFVVAQGRGLHASVVGTDAVAVLYCPRAFGTLAFILLGFVYSARAIGRSDRRTVLLSSDVPGALLGLLLRRRYRLPLVAQFQGHLLSPGPEYGSRPKRWLIARTMRAVARRAEGVRCLNRAIESEVRAVDPPGVVVTIGSRVDTSIFRPAAGSDREVTPRVIAVGALVARKNHVVLVRALAKLREEHPDARLVLVGDGPERARLRALVDRLQLSDRVEMLGRVDHRQVPDLLRNATIFALPSLSEGQPRVVLEAQACGLPVVASSIPAVADVVADERTGLVVEPTDVAAWTNALGRLLDDAELRTRLGATARDHVEHNHDFHRSLDDLARFIRRAAEAA